jgi:flagellar basal body P-ring formation protein FlgA
MRCSARQTASNGDTVTRAIISALLLVVSASASAATGTAYVHASDLRSAVESYVASLPVRDGSEYAVECRDVPDSIALPSGTLRLRVDPTATPVLRGRVGIAVEIAVDGVTVRRVVVPALIRTFAGVLLSTRRLDARAPVGPGDVRSARVESTEWTRRPVTDAASLSGKRTRRFIAEGSVLFEELFEQVPLVAHGDPVTLRASSTGVTVSTGAVAMEDGVAGSVITVKASYTHERIKARIVGPALVEPLGE